MHRIFPFNQLVLLQSLAVPLQHTHFITGFQAITSLFFMFPFEDLMPACATSVHYDDA